MASPPLIAIVTSDRPRNGKTLLARVMVDHLLLEGHDPYCLDLSQSEGALRAYFPGRTALVDFSQIAGQMKVFDTILTSPGRDYVIDVPAAALVRFCEVVANLDFLTAARDKGFAVAVLYIIDESEESLKTAAAVEEILLPDLFVPVVNRFVGSALPETIPGVTVTMERLDSDLLPIIGNRRFSFRNFLLGDEAAVPFRLRSNLKTFLHAAIAGLRDIAPALTLRRARE